jgi:hypothetical protein
MCERCFNLGKTRRGRPHRIRRDEVEDGLNVMEIKTDRQWPETIRNENRLYRKPRYKMDCSA